MNSRKYNGRWCQTSFPVTSQEDRILSAFRARPERTIWTLPSIRVSAKAKVYEMSLKSNLVHLHRNRMLFVCPVGLVLDHLLGVDFISDVEKEYLKECYKRHKFTTIVISCVPHLNKKEITDERLFRVWDDYFDVIEEEYNKNRKKYMSNE